MQRHGFGRKLSDRRSLAHHQHCIRGPTLDAWVGLGLAIYPIPRSNKPIGRTFWFPNRGFPKSGYPQIHFNYRIFINHPLGTRWYPHLWKPPNADFVSRLNTTSVRIRRIISPSAAVPTVSTLIRRTSQGFHWNELGSSFIGFGTILGCRKQYRVDGRIVENHCFWLRCTQQQVPPGFCPSRAEPLADGYAWEFDRQAIGEPCSMVICHKSPS